MKKKIVVFVMLMMCVASVSAQWSLTPEVGMTAVTRNDFFAEKWNAGWKLGVGVEYQFQPGFFSLKSGLYYTQRGYKSQFMSYASNGYNPDGSMFERAGGYSEKTNRHLLQVPLLANFSFDLGKEVRLNLGVGPYLGVSMADRWESCGYNYSYGVPGYGQGGYGYGYPLANESIVGGYGNYGYGYSRRDLRPIDWGINATVGIEVKQWVVNAGYEVSLGQEYTGQNIRANYHSLSLSVGYKFKLGK